MLADLVDQVCARCLLQISDAPSHQRELRALQLRQIKRERNLSLKPWLHRVFVGRNYVDRRCAGQRSHMQVGQLAVDAFPRGPLALNIEVRRQREDQHENRGHENNSPSPSAGFGGRLRDRFCNRLCNFGPQLRARLIALAGHLHGPLQLHSIQSIGSTSGATLQVRAKRRFLGRREFAVNVEIELLAPLLTGHADLLLTSAAASHARLCALGTGATCPSPPEPPTSRQSPGKTFPPLRTAAIPRENVPAILPKPAAPSPDSPGPAEGSPALCSPRAKRPPALPRPAPRCSSAQFANSETNSAECGTSTRENSCPVERKRIRAAPWHNFPAPSLRPRRCPGSASARSCRAGRIAAWPALRTTTHWGGPRTPA